MVERHDRGRAATAGALPRSARACAPWRSRASGRGRWRSAPTGSRCGPALIWMDARGARRTPAGSPAAACGVAGYDPRKLARWIRRTGGAPSLSGRDPLGHILWLRAERPDVYRAAAAFLEPVDWLGFRLSGRIATTGPTATLHWVTDTRDAARVRYDDELIALAGLRPRASCRSCCRANAVLGPADRGRAPRSSGLAARGAGRRRHAGHDVGRRRLGRGRRPRRAPLRRHVGLALLPRALQAHGPAALGRLAAGRPPRPLARLDRAGDRRRLRSSACATCCCRIPAPPASPSSSALAATARRRAAAGVVFTPWLNGERTPVDDQLVRGGLHNLTLRHDAPSSRPRRVRGRRAERALDAARGRALLPPAAGADRLRRRRRAVARCGRRSWPTCSGARCSASRDPAAANLRGAGAAGVRRARRAAPDELHGRAPVAARARSPTRRDARDLRRALRGLPRTLYKRRAARSRRPRSPRYATDQETRP